MRSRSFRASTASVKAVSASAVLTPPHPLGLGTRSVTQQHVPKLCPLTLRQARVQQRRVVTDALAGHLGVGRVQFDADERAVQAGGDDSGGARAGERVEHGRVLRCPARTHGSISFGGKVAKCAPG
jgi:hypothetical protein